MIKHYQEVLKCNKCGKTVHANQACSKLSPKQLEALKVEDLDWTCDKCLSESPRRKSSFIIPDDDSDEEDDEVPENCRIATKSLMKNISREVKKVVQREMASFAESVDYCTKKIEDLYESLHVFSGKIKELEKKNTHLLNQNTHLQLKLSAVEQQVRNIEQNQLDDKIDVLAIPEMSDENLSNITDIIAKKINLNPLQIKTIKRIKGRKDQEGIIRIGLGQIETVSVWIKAIKNGNTKAKDIVQNLPSDAAENKIIARRALTTVNKTLLWNAKRKLQNTYELIWFQNGKVLARKGDNDEVIVMMEPLMGLLFLLMP